MNHFIHDSLNIKEFFIQTSKCRNLNFLKLDISSKFHFFAFQTAYDLNIR